MGNFALAGIVVALGAGVLAGRTPAFGHAPKSAPTRVPVRVRFTFAGRPLALDDVGLHNRAGTLFSISRLSFLISDIALMRSDGGRVELPGEVAWVDAAAGRTSFDLTGVPIGKYAGLSFRVGLAPKLNHADPAKYPPAHPLNPALNRLHWGWQGGYVFFAIEGRYEQPGGRLGGYSYHLATDADPMYVSLHEVLDLTTGRQIDLRLDVAAVFDSAHHIAMRSADGSDSSHSAPGDTLATKLKENVTRAFDLDGVASTSARTGSAPPDALNPIAPPRGTTAYALPIPASFPQPALPADNPLTVEGIALGKRLFFDPRLSGNNRQSCATCHQASNAYSDRGHALSPGIDGKPGHRNAMPLFNLAWASAYTWDGRRTRLRDQVLSPIQDAREMHQSLPQTMRKIAADAAYPRLFARAFGGPGVTADRLGLAVEQYLLTILSADSKFDRALRQEATFTDQEKQGLLLFITEYNPARQQYGADCFHCHGGNLFTDYQFKNNGVYDAYDIGRAVVTHRDADIGKFKTPSLRNVELTGPYMHDGRFKTLEEVIEHYNSGVHRSATLDPNIAKHPDDGLKLSESDKKALVAFLKTLTDERFRKSTPLSPR